MRDAGGAAAEMLEEGGREKYPTHYRRGSAGHGDPRSGPQRGMGNDPKKSVLNPFCQSHDISNLVVADGSGFYFVRVPESDSHHDGNLRPCFRSPNRPFSAATKSKPTFELPI